MKRLLVLALGNDILGDDGVGFAAARLLKKELPEDFADIQETAESGLALLDFLEGYDKALLLDAISTGKCPPGTILEYSSEDFCKITAPSPHFAGLPEILQMAEKLNIPFPKDILILAMEIENPLVLTERLSPEIQKALPEFVKRAKKILRQLG